MIYVFYVNRGSFITFEDRITAESVAGLKQAIYRTAEIPIKSQVILVSGGYEPSDRTLVGDCNAGLEDNNPIYLYRKVETDSQPNETVQQTLTDVTLFQERVSSLMNVQPSYKTMRQRVQLAKDFSEHAKVQMESVRRLVKEQHMMSQGWYVALANLDEKCERIKRRYEEFRKTWDQYMENRATYHGLVDNFEEVMDLLERIKLPESLVNASCDVSHMSASSITASQVAALKEFQLERGRELKPSGISLLDWLNSFDKRGSLNHVLGKVRQTLERVNESVANKIGTELPDSLALANENSQEHRVVQGLEMRLTQMSHYQNKAELRCRNQYDLTATLASNLERLEKERDASVVGELCKQHKRVLHTLADNHKKQTEAVQFALNGKNDFMHNLHMRFLWLTRVEMMLISQESYFGAVYTRLHEMTVHKKVLSQAKVAARLYAETLVELVRRREFAERYGRWTGDVVDLSTAINRQEVANRERAVQRLDNHFLWCLFRSMKRMPSKFASKRPSNVDSDLPALTRADVDELRARVPELGSYLVLEEEALEHVAHLSPLRAVATSDAEIQTAPEVSVELGSESASQPIAVPRRPQTDSPDGSPFVEMSRAGPEEEEVFSSALLNLDAEAGRRSEAAQTDEEAWRQSIREQLLRLQRENLPDLRRSLANVCERLHDETESAKRDADVLQRSMTELQSAFLRQVETQTASLRTEMDAERQVLVKRLEEAVESAAKLQQELVRSKAESEQTLVEQERRSARRCQEEVDQMQKTLLLEHEVALEGERGRHSREIGERMVELRETERQLEWKEERLNSVTKERDLLERASVAEKKMYETELARLRDELDMIRSSGQLSRRGRRISISSDSPQHIMEEMSVPYRRISVATVNTDSADEAELLEVEEVGGWTPKKDTARSPDEREQQERIAELEALLLQRDSHISDLQRTVDRLSQQAMRDRDYIRQLRSNNDPNSRSVLGSSPQQPQLVSVSRSPPVLEQPGPISSSFMMMTSSTSQAASSTSTAPVTCPPRSVLGAPGVQTSSMTESAISSVSVAASTPPNPVGASPRTPDAAPISAMMSASSSSQIVGSSQRALKIVLSQFRSGDRVLLLRNPSTGLWFMLSTDGWSYFVHSDCFSILELDSQRFYLIAEFKSKERCLARKDKNRFSLPAGNYFFRIKARPLRAAIGQAWPGQTPAAGQVTDASKSIDKCDDPSLAEE